MDASPRGTHKRFSSRHAKPTHLSKLREMIETKKALQDHEAAAVDPLDEDGKRLLTSPHPQPSEDIEGSTKCGTQ